MYKDILKKIESYKKKESELKNERKMISESLKDLDLSELESLSYEEYKDFYEKIWSYSNTRKTEKYTALLNEKRNKIP